MREIQIIKCPAVSKGDASANDESPERECVSLWEKGESARNIVV
jgi:hypothetical protein